MTSDVLTPPKEEKKKERKGFYKDTATPVDKVMGVVEETIQNVFDKTAIETRKPKKEWEHKFQKLVCPEVIRRLKKGQIRRGFYLHCLLKNNLDYEVKRVNKKWDSIVLIDGPEGSAKTTLASTCGYYMASRLGTTFGLDDIIFTIPQFEEWIMNKPPGSVCQWDEFVLAGMSSEGLTKIQNTLIKKMTLIRKRRLVIILVIPYIFMLRKYFAIARTRFLIHVYSPDNLSRGLFMFFSSPRKRILYMKGLKFWEYMIEKPDFIGDFVNTYGLFWDTDKYEQKKNEATDTIESDNFKLANVWKKRFLLYAFREKLIGHPEKESAEKIGMGISQYMNLIQRENFEEDIPLVKKGLMPINQNLRTFWTDKVKENIKKVLEDMKKGGDSSISFSAIEKDAEKYVEIDKAQPKEPEIDDDVLKRGIYWGEIDPYVPFAEAEHKIKRVPKPKPLPKGVLPPVSDEKDLEFAKLAGNIDI